MLRVADKSGPVTGFAWAFFFLTLLTADASASDMAEPRPYDVTARNAILTSPDPDRAPPERSGPPLRGATPLRADRTGPPPSAYREIYPDRWMVRLEPAARIDGLTGRLGARLLRRFQARGDWFLLQAPEGARSGLALARFAEALARSPLVAEIVQDGVPNITTMAAPTDPLLAQQWHLENIGQSGGTPGEDARVREAWRRHGVAGRGVTIAVIDDGVQTDHPDLRARYRSDIDYDYNFQDADPDPFADRFGAGSDPHGTAVAGVAAGDADGLSCGVGAAYQAEITGRRILGFGTGSSFSWSYVASAFTDNLNQIEIYNNSWGFTESGTLIGGVPVVSEAIAQVSDQGRGGLGSIVLFAGGNARNQPELSQYDGLLSTRHVIAIAAMNDDGGHSFYSERGSNLLVTAPSNHFGSGITTSDLADNFGYNQGSGAEPADRNCTARFGGTSSATPLAAGIVALMLEANPELTWRDVQHILARSARKNNPGQPEWRANGAGIEHNLNYGFGAVDAEKAVRFAKGWTGLPPETVASPRALNLPSPLPLTDATASGPGPWATSAITVTRQMLVEGVELIIRMNHEDGSDVEMWLESPSGHMSVVLEPSLQGIAINGTYRLVLRDFLGERSAGTWTLWARDVVSSGIGGSLTGWGMDIYGSSENAVPYVGIEPGADYVASNGTVSLAAEVVALDNQPFGYSWGADCPDPSDGIDLDPSDGVAPGALWSPFPWIEADGDGFFEDASGPVAVWRAPIMSDSDGPTVVEGGQVVSGGDDLAMVTDCALHLSVSASALSGPDIEEAGETRIDLLPVEVTPPGRTPEGLVTSLLPAAGVAIAPGSDAGLGMDGFVAFTAVGGTTLYNCRVEHEGPLALDSYFHRYSYWDGLKQLGDMNEPFVVHPGLATFVVYGVQNRKTLGSVNVTWRFRCDGVEAPQSPEVNSLVLTAKPGADTFALASIASPHPGNWAELLPERGRVRLNTAVGLIGEPGPVTVDLRDRLLVNRSPLPLSIKGCLMGPNAEPCTPSLSGPVPASLVPDDRSTELSFEGVRFFSFEVRLNPGGVIARDPANNRLYLVVRDAGGDIIGATSIAITTSDVEGGGFGMLR